MSKKPVSAIVAVGLLAALATCSLDQGTQDTVSGILVHGRVDTEAGAAVPGVLIKISFRSMAACGAPFLDAPNPPTTDSAGGYVLVIGQTGGPQTVCVKVVATPPANLPLAPESALVGNVQFTERMDADSVRIDVVLPPK